jgi:DNA uptake protein ComE-like DNA-binding protein
MAGRLRHEDPIEAVSAAADEVEAIEAVPAPPPEPSARVRAPLPPPDPGASGPINLNEATFEMLRSLGCSVTQTARILAARKVRGGFGSPAELSDVPGLPAAFRAELISRLTV